MLRCSLLFAGLSSALWFWAVLPAFRLEGSVRDVATRATLDDQFRPGVLKDVLALIEGRGKSSLWPPELIRSEALIGLRIAEDAMRRGSSEEADRKAKAAEHQVEFALLLSPADSYLWLLLYSAKTARNGFDVGNIRFLDQSYSTAPLEAWIALRRNSLALAVFPMLNDATRQKIILEFAELVDSNFTEEAAISLTTVGWPQRVQLLAGVERADIESRETLARRLRRDGIKVSIPGIPDDERRWR